VRWQGLAQTKEKEISARRQSSSLGRRSNDVLYQVDDNVFWQFDHDLRASSSNRVMCWTGVLMVGRDGCRGGN